MKIDIVNQTQDELFMRRAIELAKEGAGSANPNPMVGAIVVKNGRIIGEGYHKKYGELHAERNALASCIESPDGATMYITLEPCCHYGKTPPCTEAIIESNISKVVIGSKDPNPLVAGKGIRLLREVGIEVTDDFLREECDKLYPVFFHFIKNKTPYVTLKYAMSLDGKIAAATGKSQWISCEASRIHTHDYRANNMAIMVGVGTVIKDNPSLTCRNERGISPIRVICDTKLKTPLDCEVVMSAFADEKKIKYAETTKQNNNTNELRLPRTIIASSVTNENLIKKYEERGVTILYTPQGQDGHIDLHQLMIRLGAMKIDSMILEGGGTLNWSALNAGVVNKIQCYLAPKILGGKDAATAVQGTGVSSPSEAFKVKNTEIKRIGDDIFIESELK